MCLQVEQSGSGVGAATLVPTRHVLQFGLSMQNETKVKASPDGRHLRSERSRSVIAKAMLELVRETGQMPTTDSVADRAGVSRRSVFRHYADVSELLSAAYELQREDAFTRYPPRDPSQWSESERVQAFTERGTALYEYVSSVRRAAVHMSRDYPVLNDLMRDDDTLHRSLIAKLFDSSFDKLNATDRITFLNTMVAASSWSAWEAMRHEQGLDVEAARDVIRTTFNSVLAYAKTKA